ESFNESQKLAPGETRQWVIRAKDRRPIPIAVIFEDWRGMGAAETCFIMIATTPNDLIARVSNRMPAIIEQKDWPVWLGQIDAPFRQIKALLRPFDDRGHWEIIEQDKLKAAKPLPPKSSQLDLF